MTDWSKAYGDAADVLGVRPGDVWRVGPHVLACCDLERSAVEFVRQHCPAGYDLFYSDPPWDTGNAKSFRTKARLAHDEVTIARLMSSVLDLTAVCNGDVYVEMGTKHLLDLRWWMGNHGLHVLDEWPITYYGSKRCWLVRARSGSPTVVAADFSEQDDSVTPRWAIEASSLPGQVVFDPCTGLGATPLAAHATGRVFRGLELNERRLAVTLQALAAAGAGEPTKIGEL